MAFPMTTIDLDANSPLSKRRKFTPPSAFLPAIIPSETNSAFENHTFNSPILPQLSSQAPTSDEIESSLLQVGMRIRKSVNDGYQNKKKFTPRPFANNLARLSPETQKALLAGNTEQTKVLEPYYAGGMHEVGGLRQPTSTLTFCGVNLAMMSWSSEDQSSKPDLGPMWSYSTSHKRGYEADSDSEGSDEWLPRTPALTPEFGAGMAVDYFSIGTEMMDSDVSPFTQPGESQVFRGRRMAMPKSRMMKKSIMTVGAEEIHAPFQLPPTSMGNPFDTLHMQQQPVTGVDGFMPQVSGHRRMMSCGMEANMMDNSGFGDAEFLARRDDVEMDCS